MGRFQFGQIVLAYMSDGHGHTRDRPALIISSDEDNNQGEVLQLIAITKRIDHPCPRYHILIQPDAKNGLSTTSVAKCNWVRDVPQERVQKSLGYLDDALLEVIVDAFDELFNDAEFDGWD